MASGRGRSHGHELMPLVAFISREMNKPSVRYEHALNLGKEKIISWLKQALDKLREQTKETVKGLESMLKLAADDFVRGGGEAMIVVEVEEVGEEGKF
ncbi:hypothetical protein GOBAR_DD16523 [Gossypium barbadense]|nr:hypothetical protein GOBAR_DD16523 [Gossypium barbadense]